MKILLAADGSEYTRKAARALAKLVAENRATPEIRVHHVVPALPYGGAARVVGKKAIDDYHREVAEEALAVAAAELTRMRLKFTSTWSVGEVAAEIAAVAKKHKCDIVVVGSRGHGALAGMALGSVAMKLLATLPIPVLIVR
jgi:nucleotide-binding universal stress UspA family protein